MSDELKPDGGIISHEDILTQFAAIRTKDGRVVVQFPVLDPTTQEVDVPAAMELAAAGLQTLARVVRQQKKDKPLIAVAPPMKGLKGD